MATPSVVVSLEDVKPVEVQGRQIGQADQRRVDVSDAAAETDGPRPIARQAREARSPAQGQYPSFVTASVTVTVAVSRHTIDVDRITVGRREQERCIFQRDLPSSSTFTGASFTGVTLIVIVSAEGSRSTPPLRVPPLSCTWKV